jgi:hypothetical protein
MGYISIDPDAFRAWLLAHGGHERVGVAASALRCPLACFLNEQGVEGIRYEVSGARVWGYDVAAEFLVNEASLPGWAERFVGLVDSWVRAGDVACSVAVSLLDQTLVSHGQGSEVGG